MRSSRTFASASKSIGFILCFAALAYGDEPGFIVTPSTVVAGRTLTVSIRTNQKIDQAHAAFGRRRAEFYPVGHHWRALVGIGSAETPGAKTLRVEGQWLDGTVFASDVGFDVVAGTYPMGNVRLPPGKTAMYSDGRVDRDTEFLAAFFTQPGAPEKYWAGVFRQPAVGVVSSVYGARRTYGDGTVSSPHSGMDIANPAGTPVQATAPGRIVFAGWLESFGNVVMIDHGQGVYDYFLHMRSLTVQTGQFVKTGAPLGEMGQEGVATGPHVHWSFAVGGERVDPGEWAEKKFP